MAGPLPVPGDVRRVGPWRNAVMIAFALGGVAVSTWGPRLPQLRADLGVDDAAIGLILVGVTVGSILGLTVASALLSRLGSRRGIRWLFSLIGAGIAWIGISAGVAHSTWFTAVGFVLVGFGIGAVDVMINVEGAAVERAARKTLMPLLHASWSAGAILGAGIGAGCAALDVPVQWQFGTEAVLIVASAAVATRFLPVAEVVDPAGARPPVGQRISGWLRGWGDWRLLLIGCVMLGVELGEGTANNWLTLAVRDGHHRSDAIAASFFIVFAASETLVRVVGGPLVDRVGRVRAVQFTTGLGVVGVLLFILAGPAWLILLGTVLWATGVSMGFPLGMSAAAESGPNSAARVSVVASIGYLANLGGPPAVGFLSRATGILGALWLVAAFLLLSFATAGSLRTRRGGTAPNENDR